jgi:chitodextrinase
MQRHLAGSLRAARSYKLALIAACAVLSVLAGIATAQARGKDATAPTAPANLAANAGDRKADLKWGASTDNTVVKGYRIYRNGAQVGTVGGSTLSYSDSSLTNGTTYNYVVKAYDRAGNLSPASNQVTATPTGSTSDTTAPSTPWNLTATATDSSVSLSWSASSDNVGVAGYGIYNGSTLSGTTGSTSYTLTGLSCGKSYSLAVDAYDAAGNRSGKATVTTTTSACPTSGVDPSGQNMPTGNITGWRQIWADNFPYNVSQGNFPAGTNGKWSAYPDGWHDTSGNGTYNCTKVCSVHNGMLDMWIHSENGAHYVAVPFPKLPASESTAGDGLSGGNGLQYGRYAVRFTADPLPRYKTAWLLWPDSNTWPRDGEIDFPEGNLDSNICAFMHHQGATSGGDQDAFCSQTRYTGWHTAVTEWTPSSVKFYLDGTLLGNSTSRIPNTPMHWVLQTETQLSSTAPDNSTQGHVYVDWAAVYRPA